MSAAVRPVRYHFAGHDEHCLSAGTADAERRILIVQPLFDEMNRMRRVLVQVMRDLERRGLQSFLPDLPGYNESMAALSDQDLDHWRGAVSAAAAQFGATHIASIRGGCLIDDGIPHLPHWRLAPAKGAQLLKTMIRARIAGDREAGLVTHSEALIASAQKAPVELAGNRLSAAMLHSLESAEAKDLPILTLCNLGSDGVEGSALWLRAEPQDDPQMSVSLATHLDNWSASCGG
ncbi:MAG: hypothetical protein HC843_05705 [Sphingomonadales bacterium]|nr:hypothetical protein [Sphingomonadales bacterium]